MVRRKAEGHESKRAASGRRGKAPPAAVAVGGQPRAQVGRKTRTRQSGDSGTLSPQEIRQMLDALEDHQAELEVQNEQLRTAQEELEEARARYFDLYNLAPVGYCTLSKSGLILEANLTAATQLSIPRSRLEGQPFYQFVFAQDNDIYHSGWQELLETGHPQARELRMVRTDGALVWVRLEMRSAQDHAGKPVCRVVMSVITDRKRAEEALRVRQQQLRLFIEHCPAAIAMFDRDMKYLAVSRRWLSDYRLTEPAIRGRSHYDVFPDLPERWKEVHHRCLAGASEKGEADRFPRQDGTVDWVRWDVQPWKNGDGEIGGLIIFSEVLTERRKAVEALRRSEQLNREVISNAQVGVIVYDLEFRYVLWNPFMEELTGKPTGEVLGKNAFEVFPHLREQGAEPLMRRALGGETVQSYEIAYMVSETGKSGWVSSTYSPHYGAKGEIVGVIGMVQEITQRRQAEAELADRLRFETLLADLSGHFLNVPAGELELEIEDAQRRVCECLELDGCALFQFSEENPTFITLTRYYRAVPGPAVPEGLNAEEHFPWHYQQLVVEKVKVIALSSLENSPPEAARDRESWRQFGVEAAVTLGLGAGEAPLLGVLTFVSMGTERIWPEKIVSRLQMVAQLFSSALARRRSDQALRQSEERFRTLFEKAPQAISCARNGREVYVNQKFLELFGYERSEEVVGRPIQEHWAPEWGELMEEPSRLRHRGESLPSSYEAVARRRDGSYFPVQVDVTAVNLAEGQATMGFVTDISERKRAEERIKVSEERFRKAFMTGADAFCITTLSEGRILEINDRFMETYGHSRDEVIGRTPLELSLYLDPADRERLVTAIRTEGQVRNMEEKRRKKNGEVITILLSANLLQGSGEDIILSASRDITEQRRAEAALLRVRQAVDASGEVVFMTDAEGIFTFVNPEFTRLYGYAEGEVVGKLTPRILQSGMAPPEKNEAFRRSLRQKRVVRGEIVNRTRDDRLLTMHSSVSPILSETGETLGYMTIQRDITERKQTQQELERSFGQLRALAVRLQGVREEERKRLARELHDQLGQALTAIKLDVCALVREMGADRQAPLPRVSTILKLVDETTECVRRIATELRPGVLDDLGLMAAIEWAGGDFEARTGTKCRLVLPSDEIRVDSERATAIFRILQEALTNVVRHAAASEVEVRLETKENELILLVHDNGKGMDEGKISRGESLGILGMKERARLFGGQVMIYGACGTGTTVRVRIPTEEQRVEEPL